ncbi:MAG: D-2-hydroxyacid dehydrogenase [Saprospiraceae bacterium]|nr:D-2-hydroxyacid dehydrogenase [Bacteroidia bacterium]NNE14724.1 D-2-hydroxyacid dehydrogenase [Saprospiraceae bacterium]NNL93271.1 D-2-hydroxyacid dehydrogenase [Saprospiraceae bacterium]
MKIVFLDAYTLNPGDIDVTELSSLGDIKFYDRSREDEILERCIDASVIITNKCVLTKEIIEKLPELKLIQVAATGYNNIDLETAKNQNITVCNVQGYSTESVVQHTFALLLSYLNNVSRYNREVSRNEWSTKKDFSYWEEPILDLSGLTFGVVGYGKIGSAIADVALAFGMKVLVSHTRELDIQKENLSFHSLDYVLNNVDILSLNAPLNKSTHQLINAETLSKMKSNAILINTSRGGLVNEMDLADAIKKNIIKAALLDVMMEEPPPMNHPLFALDNCIITPHQAWANQGARKKLLNGIIGNIRNFQKGKPSNVVV